MALHVLDLVVTYPAENRRFKIHDIGEGLPATATTDYFDGAATSSTGGDGAVFYISQMHFLLIRPRCGCSTNSRSKLLALYCTERRILQPGMR